MDVFIHRYYNKKCKALMQDLEGELIIGYFAYAYFETTICNTKLSLTFQYNYMCSRLISSILSSIF